MLKKVLSLMIVGIISIGLIGCGNSSDTSSNSKVEDNLKKPSKQDILFGEVEEDENGSYILNMSYDDAKNKSIEICNELIEFTKGKFDSDVRSPESVDISGDEVNSTVKAVFEDSKKFSSGEVSFSMREGEYVNMFYSGKMDCGIEDFKFDNYNLVKTQLEWFIDKGYKIDLHEIEKNINEKLLPEIKGLLGKSNALDIIEAERIEIPIDDLTSITIGGWENWVVGLPDARVVVNLSRKVFNFKD